jgi:hypothetical protein
LRRAIAKAHYRASIQLEQKRDLAGAAPAYEAAVRLDPAFADAHDRLGFMYGQPESRHSGSRLGFAAIQACKDQREILHEWLADYKDETGKVAKDVLKRLAQLVKEQFPHK